MSELNRTVPTEWYDQEAEKVRFWIAKSQALEQQLVEKDAALR